MKTHFTGFTLAALLMVGLTLPGRAEDATTPAAPPAAAQKEAAPPSVPRPSIAPKAADPAASAPAPAAAATEPEPAPHRRYAHRHWHRYGYYHTAYWEPFPIYWPHFYHSRVHWGRIPWFFSF